MAKKVENGSKKVFWPAIGWVQHQIVGWNTQQLVLKLSKTISHTSYHTGHKIQPSTKFSLLNFNDLENSAKKKKCVETALKLF